MNIETLVLGTYQTNCYIVWAEGSQTCAVIDPGYDPERVLAQVEELGLTVDAVLLTHGHFDHVGGVEAIVKAANCALWMNEGDYSAREKEFYPLANSDFTDIHFCEDQEEVTAGGLNFLVYATPGHTYGSVCFRCENALFTGDTLFAGSCGRTDLPGGDSQGMAFSMERLRELDFEGRIYPGHGPASIMAAERRHNPYLRGAL